MSSATSALKASKSIVDSYISSTERSDLTTTFTEHTISETNVSSNSGIFGTIINVIKHPKFKWAVIAVLLCICALVYFKNQNKVMKDNKKENIDKKEPINNKEQEYMQKMNELEIKEKILLEKMNQFNTQIKAQMQIPKNQPQMQVPRPQPQPQMQVPRPQPQPQHQHQHQHHPQQPSNESESSEEVFIENENVMNHNLTMEEMNAIDRQLEDVNNIMGYESD